MEAGIGAAQRVGRGCGEATQNVTGLLERLSPVLVDENPSDGEDVPEQDLVPLAGDIRRLVAGVRAESNRLRSASIRLELAGFFDANDHGD